MLCAVKQNITCYEFFEDEAKFNGFFGSEYIEAVIFGDKKSIFHNIYFSATYKYTVSRQDFFGTYGKTVFRKKHCKTL